jgi:inner membrane transporter RhtA
MKSPMQPDAMAPTLMRRPTVSRDRVPPHAYFIASATLHYLGPAFAVLLFERVSVVGVLWLRIATAAAAFAVRRPWIAFESAAPKVRILLVAFGIVLAAMNLCFYIAIARLPLGTVGAIEFLGAVALAAVGMRTRRNALALLLSAIGVYALTHVHFAGQAIGYVFAFANCALFLIYVVIGHHIAAEHGAKKGIDILGAAMCVALIVVTPVGFLGAIPAFLAPKLLFAGIVVGLTSSVIPYVFDQLAMARLPRSSFALLLSLMPLTAAIIGIVVLRQIPGARDVLGLLFVTFGVALHRPCAPS